MEFSSFSPPREVLLSKASLASGRRIGYFLAAVGIVLLVWGDYLFCRERNFLAHARHSTARVVEMQPTRTRFGMRYSPVFAYADSAGRQWRIVSDPGVAGPAPAVGQTADIVHLPDNPGHGQLKNFFARWGVALVFGTIGALTALVGYVGTGIFEWIERTTYFP